MSNYAYAGKLCLGMYTVISRPPTGHELADAWLNINPIQQAAFFKRLAVIRDCTPANFELQLRWMTSNTGWDADTQRLVEEIRRWSMRSAHNEQS